MSSSRRSRLEQRIRILTSPDEVVYPAALYVQQSNATSEEFGHTVMFSSPPSNYVPGEPNDDWYPADEPTPEDLWWAPFYGSTPYASDYNREATASSGGYVSTAPDLCRILDALDPLEGVLSEGATTMLRDTGNETASEIDKPGWRWTPGGMYSASADYVEHGGSATGTKTRMRYHLPTGIRVAICTNATRWDFNLEDEIMQLVETV